MEFGEYKSQRQNQWQRRKGHKTRNQKQGHIGGNPRYGKSNSFATGNPNKHRQTYQQPDAA